MGLTARKQEPGHVLEEMNALRAEFQKSNAKMAIAIQVILTFLLPYSAQSKESSNRMAEGVII